MALVVNDLASVMMEATENQTDAYEALLDLGNAIESYLNANNLMTFSWLAFDTYSNPDPVTICTGKISGINITLTPSESSNRNTTFTHLSAEIKSGCSTGTYNVTTSGFSTSPNNLTTAPSFTSLSIFLNYSSGDDTRLHYFRDLASQIITWVIGMVPTGTCAGTHGSYTGIATPVSIT